MICKNPNSRWQQHTHQNCSEGTAGKVQCLPGIVQAVVGGVQGSGAPAAGGVPQPVAAAFALAAAPAAAAGAAARRVATLSAWCSS